ncbi:MAG TPA: hypothetical protein VFV38_24790 [Ktedonobacteraceae bacterium]|nr:hypothetical protein [Ktedonobacteraceae bacterium]
MIRGSDETRKQNFTSSFGLKLIGKEKRDFSTERLIPEIEVEISCRSNPPLSGPVDVHEVVVEDDVLAVLPRYIQRGYTIVIEPFEISLGKCAIIQDTSGTRLCLFEKILRPYYLKAISVDGALLQDSLS